MLAAPLHDDMLPRATANAVLPAGTATEAAHLRAASLARNVSAPGADAHAQHTSPDPLASLVSASRDPQQCDVLGPLGASIQSWTDPAQASSTSTGPVARHARASASVQQQQPPAARHVSTASAAALPASATCVTEPRKAASCSGGALDQHHGSPSRDSPMLAMQRAGSQAYAGVVEIDSACMIAECLCMQG